MYWCTFQQWTPWWGDGGSWALPVAPLLLDHLQFPSANLTSGHQGQPSPRFQTEEEISLKVPENQNIQAPMTCHITLEHSFRRRCMLGICLATTKLTFVNTKSLFASLSRCQASFPNLTRATSRVAFHFFFVFIPDFLISSQSEHLSAMAEIIPVLVLGRETFLWNSTQIMWSKIGICMMPASLFPPGSCQSWLDAESSMSCLHFVALLKYFVMYSSTLSGSNPVISASTCVYCLSSITSLVSLQVRSTKQCGRLSLVRALSTQSFVPFLYWSYPSSRRSTFWFFSPSRICLIWVDLRHLVPLQSCMLLNNLTFQGLAWFENLQGNMKHKVKLFELCWLSICPGQRDVFQRCRLSNSSLSWNKFEVHKKISLLLLSPCKIQTPRTQRYYVWVCSGQHRSRAFSWLSLFTSFTQRGEPISPIPVGWVAMNQSHTCGFAEECLLALTWASEKQSPECGNASVYIGVWSCA